jgi:hypothetical protein
MLMRWCNGCDKLGAQLLPDVYTLRGCSSVSGLGPMSCCASLYIVRTTNGIILAFTRVKVGIHEGCDLRMSDCEFVSMI